MGNIIMRNILLLVKIITSCSSGPENGSCECLPDFKATNASSGSTEYLVCYKKYTTAKTYIKAKEECESIDSTFPRIDSYEEIAFFTQLLTNDQWVQATKTGTVINLNRWRDWNGKYLRGVDWYQEEEGTEYQVNVYAYLNGDGLHTGTDSDKKSFIC